MLAPFLKSCFPPEHRNEIDPKYRKKIEAIVRKQRPQDKESEEPPKLTSCPFCNTGNVPESDLYCGQCKSNLVNGLLFLRDGA